MSKNNFIKSGFTVIEMAIVVPIVALVVLGLISVTVQMIRDASFQNEITNRMAQLQLALDTIERDISYSTAFTPRIDCPLPSSNQASCYGYSHAHPTGMIGINDRYWSGTANHRLILKTLMTTNNPLDDSKNIELIHNRLPNLEDCSLNPAALANVYYQGEWDGLHRMVAVNNAMNNATCETPWQKNETTMLIPNTTMEVEFFNASSPNTPMTGIYGNISDEVARKALNEAVSVQIILKTRVYRNKLTTEEPVIITGRIRVSRIQ